MTAFDLAYTSIGEIAPLVASGAVSPIDLLDSVLARIQAYNSRLNVYVSLMTQSARQEANAAAAELRGGRWRGPLHGIPIAVKDVFDTVGTRTTCGSPWFSRLMPVHDATAVERLRRGGAVIIGKTNLDAFAFGSTTINPHFGATRNPWRVNFHPGGSSGGSAAAVAAGLAFGALGTDTGVSIRQPAACCGIVGLKPTYGLVSKYGAVPLAYSLDHVGPITRTVQDAAIMMSVLVGHDSRDPTTVVRPSIDYSVRIRLPVARNVVGVARGFFFDSCDTEVAAAVEMALTAIDALGVRLRDVNLPNMNEANAIASTIASTEAAAFYAADLAEKPEIFSDELRHWLRSGALYGATQYRQLQRVRERLTEDTKRQIAPFDSVVMPTSPVPATPISDDPLRQAGLRWRNTGPFTVVSLPAISIPCGFTRRGLPIGLQIVGKPFDEAKVLQLAYAYEKVTGWHKCRPPIEK
jgi:aspartyl-tRNA(Asn)/glutamyl-tRNA(Gln) amidotransferase subunit A